MALLRKDIKKCDRWNIDALYPTSKAWEKELSTLQKEAPIKPRKGAFSSQQVLKLLDAYFARHRKIHKLYTYARMLHDEDIGDSERKARLDRISSLLHSFQEESAWIQPTLLSLDEKILKDKRLTPYRFFLDTLIRQKKHTLDKDKEELLALSSSVLQIPYKAFSAMNNADFVFGTILDHKKRAHELTHASYSLFLRGSDRTLRKNAFLTHHKKYFDFRNTCAEMIRGAVKAHEFSMRARKFHSCLEAELYPKNIPLTVYHTLITTVHAHIDVLHDYIKLRKKALKVDKLHCYDLYVPFVEQPKAHFSYDEAVNLVIESAAPLGSEYQAILAKGLQQSGWVDKYENKGKRSGAYSDGCYDSFPYILMNFKGTIKDLFTLAHEAGHSMHSYYSRKNQLYHTADYEIFVAEVASTFQEELLMQLLLKKAKSEQEKAYLLNEKLEDIRATLFRQTMFAEFELRIHEAIENKIPLTPDFLDAEYMKLNRFYFGSALTLDAEICSEWARIPHFYYNFYVYQYATGISAALYLAHQVLTGDAAARKRYLAFISSGGSDHPIALLKKAGVDMAKPTAIEEAIALFKSFTKRLAHYTSKC